MKIASVIFVLTFVAYARSISLECSYQVNADKFYTCINTNLKIEGNETIDEVRGNHLPEYDEKNVTAVCFLSSSMRRLPQNVFDAFPNLSRFVIHGLNLMGKFLDSNELRAGDFDGANQLHTIIINSVKISKIPSRLFENVGDLMNLMLESNGIRKLERGSFSGLKKLWKLSLNYNLIKSLDRDIFKDLESLETLTMVGNSIESISEAHFRPLKNILKISLISNKLEIIDKTAIKALSTLESFYLSGNICPNHNFGTDNADLSSFEAAAANCTKSRQNQIKKLTKENEFLRSKLLSTGFKYKVVEVKKNESNGEDGEIITLGGIDMLPLGGTTGNNETLSDENEEEDSDELDDPDESFENEEETEFEDIEARRGFFGKRRRHKKSKGKKKHKKWRRMGKGRRVMHEL